MKAVSKRSVLLLFLDLNAIAFSYLLAVFIKAGDYSAHVISGPYQMLLMSIYLTMFYILDLYHPFRTFEKYRTLLDVIVSVFIGGLIISSVAYLDRTFIVSRWIFYYTLLFITVSIYCIRMIYDIIFRSKLFDKKTLILGTGSLGQEIGKIIKNTPHSGMYIVGYVYEGKKAPKKMKNNAPVVGGVKAMLSLINWYDVELVVMALDPMENLSEIELMSKLFMKRVLIVNAVQLYENINHEVPYKLLGNHYILGLMSQVRRRPYLKIKRTLDILASSILLTALFPILIIAIIPEIILSKKSPFYVQSRIGKEGKPFCLMKLRTMRKAKNGKQVVTRYGQWLRRYRIDEIPQLINVLKGEMSLVGPRPEIPYFVARSRKKTPFYDAVFSVKPGLTGWAQVLFRHATSVKDYDQKFRYNLYYLKNISFTTDLFILIKTIRVVLLGRGK